MPNDTQVALGPRSLPVLRSCDVAIAGGSFAAVGAALRLARAGKRVVLVEPRTYLGGHVTASLRPWIGASGVGPNELERLPEPVQACVDAGSRVFGAEIALRPDGVKLALEDLLLAAGVELFYASLPVGVLIESDRICGVVIGNKSGRQIIACRAVVDATETALVARLAGATIEGFPATSARYHRTLEFDGVQLTDFCRMAVPCQLVMSGDTVIVHQGYRGSGHVYVECALDLPWEEPSLASIARRESVARHRTMALAAHLIHEVPAYKNARLTSSSCELHGPHTAPLAEPPPLWARGLPSIVLSATPDGADVHEISPSDLAGPVVGLWCLSDAARLKAEARDLVRAPTHACRLGTSLAAALLASWDVGWAPVDDRPTRGVPAGVLGATALEVKEPAGPRRWQKAERRTVSRVEVPVLRAVDVLVVGGGTSGATAAAVAARDGMRTLLLEMNAGLGGTGTVGGIDSYWFGRRVGFAAQVIEAVERAHRALKYSGRRWSIEAKMFALLDEAERAGVDVLCNAITIGTLVERNRVRGVVVATRLGVFAVLGEVVIDATGDGDVAAFAGAEYVYGSARDHVALYYSFSPYARPGHTLNIKTSMVDVSDIEDYVRAILAGRRRDENSHDHSVYLAPRETRHILAETVLTLTDQLLHRRWPDVVNVHYSNHDIKGKSGADWVNMGLIPPNLEAEVPYRVLLPAGLEGVLVTGKAFSATHDAMATIRMQADLENLGGVVGIAAAMAVRAGCVPREIDRTALQRRLVEEGVLPGEVLTRALEARHFSDAELEALVESLQADHPLHAYSDMGMNDVFRRSIPFVEVCTAGRRIIPKLERSLRAASGDRRILLAQALAMYETPAAAPVLIGEIDRALAAGQLPVRTAHIRHAGPPPDQGAMPDVAYLLYGLGKVRHAASLSIWERVVDLLELVEPAEDDFKDRFKGVFFYIDAVCYGAERLGHSAALPLLGRLHALAPLRGLVAPTGFQVDIFQERRALLELAIARAMARCGGAEGYEILIDYLADSRSLLALQASAELSAITGLALGMEREAWSAWLTRARNSLRPCPYERTLDMPDETEEILRVVPADRRVRAKEAGANDARDVRERAASGVAMAAGFAVDG